MTNPFFGLENFAFTTLVVIGHQPMRVGHEYGDQNTDGSRRRH
jgi:hypothetical protein